MSSSNALAAPSPRQASSLRASGVDDSLVVKDDTQPLTEEQKIKLALKNDKVLGNPTTQEAINDFFTDAPPAPLSSADVFARAKMLRNKNAAQVQPKAQVKYDDMPPTISESRNRLGKSRESNQSSRVGGENLRDTRGHLPTDGHEYGYQASGQAPQQSSGYARNPSRRQSTEPQPHASVASLSRSRGSPGVADPFSNFGVGSRDIFAQGQQAQPELLPNFADEFLQEPQADVYQFEDRVDEDGQQAGIGEGLGHNEEGFTAGDFFGDNADGGLMEDANNDYYAAPDINKMKAEIQKLEKEREAREKLAKINKIRDLANSKAAERDRLEASTGPNAQVRALQQPPVYKPRVASIHSSQTKLAPPSHSSPVKVQPQSIDRSDFFDHSSPDNRSTSLREGSRIVRPRLPAALNNSNNFFSSETAPAEQYSSDGPVQESEQQRKPTQPNLSQEKFMNLLSENTRLRQENNFLVKTNSTVEEAFKDNVRKLREATSLIRPELEERTRFIEAELHREKVEREHFENKYKELYTKWKLERQNDKLNTSLFDPHKIVEISKVNDQLLDEKRQLARRLADEMEKTSQLDLVMEELDRTRRELADVTRSYNQHLTDVSKQHINPDESVLHSLKQGQHLPPHRLQQKQQPYQQAAAVNIQLQQPFLNNPSAVSIQPDHVGIHNSATAGMDNPASAPLSNSGMQPVNGMQYMAGFLGQSQQQLPMYSATTDMFRMQEFRPSNPNSIHQSDDLKHLMQAMQHLPLQYKQAPPPAVHTPTPAPTLDDSTLSFLDCFIKDVDAAYKSANALERHAFAVTNPHNKAYVSAYERPPTPQQASSTILKDQLVRTASREFNRLSLPSPQPTYAARGVYNDSAFVPTSDMLSPFSLFYKDIPLPNNFSAMRESFHMRDSLPTTNGSRTRHVSPPPSFLHPA